MGRNSAGTGSLGATATAEMLIPTARTKVLDRTGDQRHSCQDDRGENRHRDAILLPDVHLELPDEGEVEAVFVFTKVRFEDGTSAWSWQSPGITNQEELLGALIMPVEVLKSSMLDDWE